MPDPTSDPTSTPAQTGETVEVPTGPVVEPPTEPPAPPPPAPAEPQPTAVLTPELRQQIDREKDEAVREAKAQEKEKLYGTIEELKGSNKQFETKLEAALKELGELKESGDGRTQKQRIAELEQEVSLMKEQMETANTLQERETARLRAETYKERRLAELSNTNTGFIPELVGGDTEQEIEESIERATAAYATATGTHQAIEQATREATPLAGSGSGPTSAAPSAAPSGAEELSASDIRNMSTEEYKRRREEIHAATGVQVDTDRLKTR